MKLLNAFEPILLSTGILLFAIVFPISTAPLSIDNRLGNKYKENIWYRKIITSLFEIHSSNWNIFCLAIYSPPPQEKSIPAKEYLLQLVYKYSIPSILPKVFKKDQTV